MVLQKVDIIMIRNAQPYDFGGGEKTPVLIAHEISIESDLKVIVFSHSEKLLKFANLNNVLTEKTWWWSQQNWSGWKVFLSPIYFSWQAVLFLYYVIKFQKYQPSVVHIQSKDDFIAGTLAARLLNIKVIWSDYADLKHIFMNHSKWYKNPIGKMVYLTAHVVSDIIVVSKEDLRLISLNIPDGIVKKKLHVIYNGAFDVYKPIKKYNKFTIISTGRLVTDKGIKELINAFILFHSKYSDTQLYIIGDGPEKDSFIKMADSHDSIFFLGHKANPLEYVNKSHIFTLPTYHEGFSLAIVEACMLSMPIITTNTGGNPEIITPDKTGILVPIKDAAALESAMERLYDNRKFLLSLGKNARKRYINEFNFKTIIKERFLPLYETTR